MAGSNALSYKHQRVQRLRRLVRRRNLREAEGVCVAEGSKLLAVALEAGLTPEAIFVETGQQSVSVSSVISVAHDRGCRVYEVAAGVLDRVCDTVTPQPVVSIIPIAAMRSRAISTDADRVVVLVDVRDPGNMGTILRSAEASGVDAVVVCDGSVDVFNPKVIRSSAGAVFLVPVVCEPFEAAVESLKTLGFTLIGTAAGAPKACDRVDWQRKIALVFGNEANGLDGSTREALDEVTSIPISGRAESLNVAMAASILCFESRRSPAALPRSLVHAIRSPLTAVVGFSGLLAKKWESLAPHERQEMLGLIEDGAQRIDAILKRSGDGALEVDVGPPAAE